MVELRRKKSALLVVDVEPDFMPGGPLAVKEADKLVKPIVKLIRLAGNHLCVATRDLHPEGHCSFASSHGLEPFSTDPVSGEILWPEHCIEGTPGSRVHPEIELLSTITWNKGTNPKVDSYSAFNDNAGVSTDLADYLRQRGVEEVVICGIAYDVCVLYTALDAVKLGFETIVVTDLCAAVSPEGRAKAIRRLLEAGVRLVQSHEIIPA